MYIPVSINLGKIPKLPNGRHVLNGNTQIYIYDGQKHRENGPAEIHRDGYKAWFRHGLRHRKGKPAVIYPSGVKEYWEKGKFIKREGN